MRTISDAGRTRVVDAHVVCGDCGSSEESFDEADVNRDGILSAPELVAALSRTGIAKSDADVEALILRCRVDADCALGDREIDFPGFVELVRLLRKEC